MRIRSVLVLVSLATSVVVCGCARRGADVSALTDALSEQGAIAPAVRGGENGLEVRWWVLDDDADRIARELRPYLQQSIPLGDRMSEHWRENGMRMVALPLSDVASIRSRLPMLGRVDRHWLGQSPRWTQILEGEPVLNQVSRQQHLLDLPDGRMRLLARAWTSPSVGAQPSMRLDLSLQFVDDLRRRDPFARSLVSDAMGSIGFGQVFDDMTIHVELREGWAYLLVPDDPTRVWDSSDRALPIETYDWGEMLGPPAPPSPTLGEALLTTLGAPSETLPRRDLRAIVLLIPRLPDTYRLLAGDATLVSN
ncbi:MAG: hypothetical protein ACF8GE_06925 [Phycisphaerales bacterium JB043]